VYQCKERINDINNNMKKVLLILLCICIKCAAQTPLDSIIPTFGGISSTGYLIKDVINKTDSIVLYYNKSSLINSRVISFGIEPNLRGTDVESCNSSNKITREQRKWINEVELQGKFCIEGIRVKINNDTVLLKNYIIISIDGPRACLFNEPNKINYSFYPNQDSLSLRTVGTERLTGFDYISKNTFLLNKYLLIANPESYATAKNIDPYAKIINYTCYIGTWDNEDTIKVSGDIITKEIKKMIKKSSKRIDFIEFDNIVAKTMNGSLMNVGSLHLTFRECYKR
jgi:hypothetical protein